MKIYIGTDHRGITMQNEIIDYLNTMGINNEKIVLSNNEQDDYPDFAFALCQKIIKEENTLGILLCGTGIGMSIAANKVKGIRAARCVNRDDAYFAKLHNNANVICLSAQEELEKICDIIDVFINTAFSDEERHHRRVEKIINYEEQS